MLELGRSSSLVRLAGASVFPPTLLIRRNTAVVMTLLAFLFLTDCVRYQVENLTPPVFRYDPA